MSEKSGRTVKKDLDDTINLILSMTGRVTPGRAERLTPELFVTAAIKKLRSPPYKGIHNVFSGFNAAFRQYFPGEDPVAWQKKLATEGKIVTRPAKGGAILYLPEDAPQGFTSGKDALRKMGLE